MKLRELGPIDRAMKYMRLEGHRKRDCNRCARRNAARLIDRPVVGALGRLLAAIALLHHLCMVISRSHCHCRTALPRKRRTKHRQHYDDNGKELSIGHRCPVCARRLSASTSRCPESSGGWPGPVRSASRSCIIGRSIRSRWGIRRDSLQRGPDGAELFRFGLRSAARARAKVCTSALAWLPSWPLAKKLPELLDAETSPIFNVPAPLQGASSRRGMSRQSLLMLLKGLAPCPRPG